MRALDGALPVSKGGGTSAKGGNGPGSSALHTKRNGFQGVGCSAIYQHSNDQGGSESHDCEDFRAHWKMMIEIGSSYNPYFRLIRREKY
jgi:hypothetical protein